MSVTSTPDNSDDYDEKNMKIKFNLDDDLPLNKMLELRYMIIVIRSVFLEGNKCYPQMILGKCLCKLKII